MSFEENTKAQSESQVSSEALSLLKEMGINPEEMTADEISALTSLESKSKETEREDVDTKKDNLNNKEVKEDNAKVTDTSKGKLKNMEGKELTLERANEFREVVKESGIEVEMTKEEAVPVVQATNQEFTREMDAEKMLSAYFGKEDPEQELNRKKVHGEMILMTLNEVYKGAKIPEKTFGSIGSESTACINLYEMMTTLYGHEKFFDSEGRMTNEGVIAIEKIAITFYELEKKHGSLQKAFRDNSENNPFYCIAQQEFVPHRLGYEGARKVWVGES